MCNDRYLRTDTSRGAHELSGIRYAFAGDRDVAVAILDFLLAAGDPPCALMISEDGKATHDTELVARCPFLPPEKILRGKAFREPPGISALESLDVDLILSVHFPYVFPDRVLSLPPVGVINLHPSLLPYGRGWHTPSWAILDDTPYGATLHFMDGGIDTGDIIHQRALPISHGDTADSIYARVKPLEIEVFKEAWPHIRIGRFRRFPQPATGTTRKRKELFRQDIQKLDLDASVRVGDLLRRLRGLTTSRLDEAAYFEADGKRYRVQVCVSEVPADPEQTPASRGKPKVNDHGEVPIEEASGIAPMCERLSAPPPPRVYLSPPHMSGRERRLLTEAFDSNWIAPLGPHVDAFEEEFARAVGARAAVALSSGTAALHLALAALGVGPGDLVATSTLTFAASANAIRYVGAMPVFIDSERRTWNMDPELLAEEVEAGARNGRPIKAVLAVDLCGQCADYEPIRKLCRFYEVPLIEDAAEALGATYQGRAAGTLGDVGCFSFNGNKIITTSGGGMLVSNRQDLVDQARFLASQARDPAPHYEHSQIGYNYRMSNLLAAVGRGQLPLLPQRVAARRANCEFYRRELADLPGIEFMPESPRGKSTRWLTCIAIDPDRFAATREDVRLALESENIESRPLWKPMHLQPAYSGSPVRGGGVAEQLFRDGLCLPSGSNLTDVDRTRIVETIRAVHRKHVHRGTVQSLKTSMKV